MGTVYIFGFVAIVPFADLSSLRQITLKEHYHIIRIGTIW